MTTRDPHLLVERRDGVVVLTVSDPARRNAPTPGLSDELAAAVAGYERDETIGALVVTGAAPAFCADSDQHASAVEWEIGPQLASLGSPAFAESVAATRARRPGTGG